MKKYAVLSLLLTFGLVALHGQAGKISKGEYTFLVNYMKVTQADLIKTVQDLSDVEWHAQPADGGWSPAMCLEHIVQAEKAVLAQVKKALAGPAGEEDLSLRDGWLLSKITDRGNKVKTPLPLSGKVSSKTKLLAEFEASRAAIYAFLADKKLPLRNHYGKSPYGRADAYQLLLVLAGHGMRHTNQILETVSLLN